METDALDRRANGAVADLLASAAATADNELLPSRRGAALVALAILVFIVAGVAFFADDEETVVANTPDEGSLTHLVPTELPEGFALAWAADAVAGADDATLGVAWMQVWGGGAPDDPFLDGDLSLRIESWSAPTPFLDSLPGPYERVDGLPFDAAFLGSPPSADVAAGTHRTLLLQFDDHRIGFMSSFTVADDQLVAIAAGVTLDGDSSVPTIDPDLIPSELRSIARLDRAASVGSVGLVVPAGARTANATWSGPDTGFNVVVADRADDDVLAINRYVLGRDDSTPLTVGDAPGWRSSDGSRILWRLDGDRLAMIGTDPGLSISPEELLAIAESLEPVGADEWAELLTATPAHGGGGEASSPTTAPDVQLDADGIPVGAVRIDGFMPDGRELIVYRNADGMVCGGIGDVDGRSETCIGPGTGNAATFYDDGQPAFVFGEAASESSDVRATVDGATLGGAVVGSEGDRIWAIDLASTGAARPDEVVEVDAVGNEVRRQPVTP